MFDLRKIFDLRTIFAVPKDFNKSKIYCIDFEECFCFLYKYWNKSWWALSTSTKIIYWGMVQSLYQCNIMSEISPKRMKYTFFSAKSIDNSAFVLWLVHNAHLLQVSFMLDAQLFANFQYHTWKKDFMSHVGMH